MALPFVMWPPVKCKIECCLLIGCFFPLMFLQPFLIRALYAPSTNSVREEKLAIFIAATYVAKGRPRRYPIMLRRADSTGAPHRAARG